MVTRRTWVVAGLLALAAAAACPFKPGNGADTLCSISAGNVSGSPSVEIGTGAHEFFSRSNGDRWLGGFGPQGGAHCWLALKSEGLGPRADVTYKMTELDGTVIYQGDPVSVCLAAASGGGQTTSGILGFITYTFPEPCSRILCGGAFKLSITVTDSAGNSASDERTVSGVDIGETPDSTSPPDCAGVTYNPHPMCDGGLR